MALWSMFIYLINPLQELYRGALLCFPKLLGFAVTSLAGFCVQHLLSPTFPEQVHLLRCVCSKARSWHMSGDGITSPGTSVWLWVQIAALKQFVWGTDKAFLTGAAVAEELLSAQNSSCLRSWLGPMAPAHLGQLLPLHGSSSQSCFLLTYHPSLTPSTPFLAVSDAKITPA